MYIIWSHTFDKQYKWYWWKQKVDRRMFITKLVEQASSSLALKRPYFKVKFLFQWHALRIIVRYYHDIWVMIPFLLTDKNDRKYWYNMTRDVVEGIIEYLTEKIDGDLKEGRFEKVEV